MAAKWVLLTDRDRANILEGLATISLKDSASSKKIEALDKRIKVSSAKGKGRNLQMWVCGQISKLLNIPFVQSDDSSLIASRPMGLAGQDIILRGDALKGFPYSIECKSSEQLDLVGTINQAKANEAKGTNWLIVHKRKAISKPIVIMEWDTFIGAIKK